MHDQLLASAENFGRSLECGFDILGFPRIIYYVGKLSESKKKKFNSEIKQAKK